MSQRKPDQVKRAHHAARNWVARCKHAAHAVALAPALLLGCSKPATAESSQKQGESSLEAPTRSAEKAELAPRYTRQAQPSAEAALTQILQLAPEARLVLLGESHAPKGATAVPAVQRFRTELLPQLAPRSAALVVESWLPPACDVEANAKIAETNREVTAAQAEENPSDYVRLAQDAARLGVTPFPLRPSCDEVRALAALAPDDRIDGMLRAITQVAARNLARERTRAPADRWVLFYGGALHNDLDPDPLRAPWSIPHALGAEAAPTIVALDLVVPEFITDSAAWQRLPWRDAYDRAAHGAEVQLLHDGGRSFVLVFAETPAPATPTPAAPRK